VIVLKLTVYLDVLLVVNFLINYILLKISAHCGKLPYKTVNIILSAAVGALFSVVMLTDVSPVLSFTVRIISVIICAFVAFGFTTVKCFIKSILFLLLSTFLFTGVIYSFFSHSSFVYVKNCFYYININPILLVGCITVVYIVMQLSEIFFLSKPDINKCQCDVTIENMNFSVTAFYDSGFSVKDILGHRCVMLCSIPAVRNKLNSDFTAKIESFLKGDIEIPENIIHVFYSDISGGGILPAVRATKIMINKKEIKNTILAFTDKSFSDDVGIIFGKDILDMIGE